MLSSDTWAAVAIYGRNLILNWLVLMPALWLLVLTPKVTAAGAQLARAGALPETASRIAIVAAVLCMITAAWYTTRGRVSDDSFRLFGWSAQLSFVLVELVPLIVAGAIFTSLVNRPLYYVGWLNGGIEPLAIIAGSVALIYMAGFLIAIPGQLRSPERMHAPVQWGRDAAAWIAAGLTCGCVLWLGIRGYIRIPDCIHLAGPDLVSADCSGSRASPEGAIILDAKSLLVIFGMPFFLLSMMIGQLVFVLLRSYSPRGDFEREWLGRAAGWFIAISLGWTTGSILVLFASAAIAGAAIVGGNLEGWLAPLGGIAGVARRELAFR